MHLKQKNSWGCGVYSLANALQLESFVNPNRIRLSKNGNFIGQLNRWLLKSKIKCWLSTIQYNNSEIIDIVDPLPSFEKNNVESWLPLFIIIKGAIKYHMIGCRYLRDGKIIVHDSLKENYDEYNSFNEFKEYYKNSIISFELLMNYEENKPVFMNIV